MLRRLPSFLSPRTAASPPPEVPPVPPLPFDNSLTSPSLTEALSYDIVNPSQRPDRTAQATEDLVKALEDLQSAAPDAIDVRLGALATAQLVLQDGERDLREAFARYNGFEVVTGALAALGALPSGAVEEERVAVESAAGDDLRYHLATLIFHVLHLALRPPSPSPTDFSFSTLSSALDISNLITPNSSVHDKCRALSLLWAFLVGDFSEGASTVLLVRSCLVEQQEADEPHSLLESVRANVEEQRHSVPKEEVVHARIFPVLLGVLEKHLDPLVLDEAQVRLLVLTMLEALLASSRTGSDRSLLKLAEAGLLEIALERWLPEGELDEQEKGKGREQPELQGARRIWRSIAARVLEKLGGEGGNVQRLFEAVKKGEGLDEDVLQVVLDAMRTSKDPPSVEFDLGQTGSGCLTLRSLGRPFPPPTHGYTFIAWICVSSPPTATSSPLVVLGATDPSSKTFLELSLTPDRHFTLRTNLRAPPVVFSAASLSLNTFHHIALVHQRPRFLTSSAPVSLYIDGVLAETVRTAYPASPPKEWDVTAWLGTPSERAPVMAAPDVSREGPRWKMGPTWLVHGELPEELVFVCHRLGPRYQGNLQDTLGRFLTNAAASPVNLRLDSISRAASTSTDGLSRSNSRTSSVIASSPLIYALRHKGAALVPEHRLYFSLSPSNLLTSTSSSDILSLTTSPTALDTVRPATAKGEAILNAAVQGRLEDAVVRLNGLAYIENGTIAQPAGLDEALFAAGGLTLVLEWVERAETLKELELAVGLFCEAVKDSWRNSEEAEERSAYETLALLLRRKASLVSLQVHDSLLALSGFDLAAPARSVVANTLAVQHIILDFQLWRDVQSSVQWAHFDRLRDFLTGEAREYNSRKLNKLHIFRKLIYAVRSRFFEEAVLDEVVDLALLVLRVSFSSESVRYLATFLAAAFTEGSAHADGSGDFVLDARSVDAGPHRSSLRLLQGLHDILLDPSQAEALAKFAKHIQTKWALLLLQDRRTPPLAAVLTLRILVRLLQTQSAAYLAKFGNRDSGFSTLRGAVPHLWHLGQTHLALFALLHEHDISSVPLDAPLQPAIFLSSATTASAVAPEVIRAIIAAVGRGLKAIEAARGDEHGRDEAKQQTHEAPGGATGSCSLLRGIEGVVELLAQAGRAVDVESNWPLLSAPATLSDLVHTLRPVLHLASPPAHPPNAECPPLPILSAANGFELPFRTTASTMPAVDAETRSSLKLQIPSSTVASSAHPSPLTALDTSIALPAAPPPQDGSITEAARLVLDLLAQQVTHGITSRHARKSAARSTPLAQFASSEPSLQPLRLILDCSATPDSQSQVVFRTLLLREILHRLSRASTAPIVAGRVAALVEVATDFALQGWLADIPCLSVFILAYAEKLIDETALAAAPAHAGPLASLFSCFNRLILVALSNPASTGAVLDLLSQHQLTAFAPQNDNGEKLQLLVCVLQQLVEGAADPAPVLHVLKLLALQRPRDVEAAFQQQDRHETGTPFVNRLLEADDKELLSILKKHSAELAPLRLALNSFCASETKRARTLVEFELKRMRELAASLKQKRDSHRRRLRKRRGSVKQDDREQVERVQAAWAEQVAQLRPQSPFGAPDTRLVLDFTEGPHRQRKKLLVESTVSNPSAVPPVEHAERRERHAEVKEGGQATPRHSPSSSPTVSRSEITPAEELTTPEDAPVEVEAVEEAEDKQRKIKRLLAQGDRILSVHNVARIFGVEACPALLLCAKSGIYLIDGYHETAWGEIVNAYETPEEERDPHLQILADIAGRNTRSPTHDRHISRSWSWQDLAEVHERRFLFRNCALELFFADGQSFLLTFSGDSRSAALGEIANKAPESVASGSLLHHAGESFGAMLSEAFVGQRTKLERMTKRWEQRLISNLEYLTFLNTTAGRSYNDLTAFPVFPWILADYTSETLDLEDEKTFRDLSKPMGSQNPARMLEFQERYAQLEELDDGISPPPFHYGSHYSSAMTAAGYLVRLQPFTDTFTDLQGGLDHADRLFWSIEKAWLSASGGNRSDVRELIPEFFYLPDFLTNVNGVDFGKRQDGESIDDVVLPPWAKGDPRLFIEKHREALESEYVSTHLSQWIDLVFGFKQRGEAAKEAVNVFSHLSYEGAIDLDQIEDPDERKAATSTIHNFGMTPRQLFTKPHPSRRPRLVPKATRSIFAPDLPVEQASPILIQTILPILSLDSAQPISSITPAPSSSMPDRVRVEVPQMLSIPGEHGLTLRWGGGDGSVRVYEKGAGSGSVPLALCEGMHAGKISRAVFADGATLVTASVDSTIAVWRLNLRPSSSSPASSSSKASPFTRLATLRGMHCAPISALAASKAYAVVVSGDMTGKAVLWDLNRLKPVRALRGAKEKVQLAAISDTTGDIVVCSASTLRLYTVNGVLLVDKSTGSASQPVTAVAWSKSDTSPILATGHAGGRVSLWKREPSSSSSTRWSLTLLNTLYIDDRLSPSSLSSSQRARRRTPLPGSQANYDETVTALSFTSRTLYAGTGGGMVHLFNPPPTEVYVPDSHPKASGCMACGTRFSLLESRRRCAACAGVFCTLDTTTSPEAGGRFCSACFSRLSPFLVQ
ncbi:hypothetical protein JCM10213_005852 [Rhodosporidiobolus nylandii]